MAHYPHLPRNEVGEMPIMGYAEPGRPATEIKAASLIDRVKTLKHRYDEVFEHIQRIRNLATSLAGNLELPSDKVPPMGPERDHDVPISTVLSTVEDCHKELSKIIADLRAIGDYLELRV